MEEQLGGIVARQIQGLTSCTAKHSCSLMTIPHFGDSTEVRNMGVLRGMFRSMSEWIAALVLQSNRSSCGSTDTSL